jgi:hypothetical protein
MNAEQKNFKGVARDYYYLATPRYLETPLENPLLFLRQKKSTDGLVIWLNMHGCGSAKTSRKKSNWSVSRKSKEMCFISPIFVPYLLKHPIYSSLDCPSISFNSSSYADAWKSRTR